MVETAGATSLGPAGVATAGLLVCAGVALAGVSCALRRVARSGRIKSRCLIFTISITFTFQVFKDEPSVEAKSPHTFLAGAFVDLAGVAAGFVEGFTGGLLVFPAPVSGEVALAVGALVLDGVPAAAVLSGVVR